MISEGLWY